MMKRILVRFEWLIAMGVVIFSLSFANVLGLTNINSDLFWAIAGLGLAVEGVIELYYEGKEDKLVFENEGESLKTLTERMNEDPAGGVVSISHGSVGVTTSFYSFRAMILKDYKERNDNE